MVSERINILDDPLVIFQTIYPTKNAAAGTQKLGEGLKAAHRIRQMMQHANGVDAINLRLRTAPKRKIVDVGLKNVDIWISSEIDASRFHRVTQVEGEHL